MGVEGATTCLLAFGQSGGWPRSASGSPRLAPPPQPTPYLVADADSGQVLIENEATAVWYPASLTKLMTVYVALDAVRAGKLTMDTPLVVSARAARMPPSKMGFRPGTEVTLDNALKMLMVKSPNDVAVTVAEGVSGSVEAFADDDERGRRSARPARIAFRQSERPAQSRARVVGARHGDDRPRAPARIPRARRPLRHRRAAARQSDHPQSQRPARPLSRRRRHEDRLHLPGRLQRRGERQPLRPASDRRGARVAVGEAAHPGGGRPVRSRLRDGRRARVRSIRCLPSGRAAAQHARRRLPAPQRRGDRGGRRGERGGGATQTWRRAAGRGVVAAVGLQRRADPHRTLRRAARVSIRCRCSSVRLPAGRARFSPPRPTPRPTPLCRPTPRPMSARSRTRSDEARPRPASRTRRRFSRRAVRTPPSSRSASLEGRPKPGDASGDRRRRRQTAAKAGRREAAEGRRRQGRRKSSNSQVPMLARNRRGSS